LNLITVKDLSLGYESRVIVKDLSFSVDEGDYLCIVGENGSGKTTLIKTLLGLQRPLGGEILFSNGLERKGIGYLPQQSQAQKDFPASVREVVISGCLGRKGSRPFYSREDRELAEKNMERMGISELAGRSYRHLSGGQQQRVLLARALCATERLLLLDEPVSGLDPRATEEMYGTIEQLNSEGVAVIMVSHDVSEALRYASHILHIGDTVFFGTRDEYLECEIGRAFTGRGDGGGQE